MNENETGNQIVGGNGGASPPLLKEHLAKGKQNHAFDLAAGCGEVHMPEALLRKYPNASREWCWQYLFPSATLCAHPKSKRLARFHLHDASMQRQFKEATRKARLSKPATCHTLSIPSPPICWKAGSTFAPSRTFWAIRMLSTTMIYLHVIKRPGAGGPSPLDLT